MRLEKGYRAFGRELTPGENPVEACCSACKLKTDVDFLGRAAAEQSARVWAAQAAGELRRRQRPDPMLWGGELILRDGAVRRSVVTSAAGAPPPALAWDWATADWTPS